MWRNEPITREMSLLSAEIPIDDHIRWFSALMESKSELMFIGLNAENEKVGYCRFKRNPSKKCSEISICINPIFRNQGLGHKLLQRSINKYRAQRQDDLYATIKSSNGPSIAIFQKCGFHTSRVRSDGNQLAARLPFSPRSATTEALRQTSAAGPITFSPVTGSPGQIEILYALLNERKHNISHVKPPTKASHSNFVKNHPYRCWQLIFRKARPMGSFYIGADNSIGLNLDSSSFGIVGFVMEYIFANWKPLPSVKSVRPDYFFCNISPQNVGLERALRKIGFHHFQSSFRLNRG
jgi:L-amino acid N-acyltransferase YncA